MVGFSHYTGMVMFGADTKCLNCFITVVLNTVFKCVQPLKQMSKNYLKLLQRNATPWTKDSMVEQRQL